MGSIFMVTRQRDESRLRILIAQECARIMAEEGVKDFLSAKRKAVARLGVSSRVLLPSNVEIEQALLAYQRLFKATEQPMHLRVRREAAAKAMRFLERFRPRLVGSVLNGTAGAHSDVTLHLFVDTLEEVIIFLMEHNIPYQSAERRLRLGNGEHACFPVLSFAAGEVNIDLTIFPREAERQAPRNPVDGRPMQRANLAKVQILLAEEWQA